MTFVDFLIRFIGAVACTLFGAGFAADMLKAYRSDEYSAFGGALMLTAGFVFGLIKILSM